MQTGLKSLIGDVEQQIVSYILVFQDDLKPGLQEVLEAQFINAISERLKNQEPLEYPVVTESIYWELYEVILESWFRVAVSLPEVYGSAGAGWKSFMTLVGGSIITSMIKTELPFSEDIAREGMKKALAIIRNR